MPQNILNAGAAEGGVSTKLQINAAAVIKAVPGNLAWRNVL